MVCETCGRDNAPNLVFCQDCGARLAARIAPPTPPIGLTTDGAPFAPPPAPVPPAPAMPEASPRPPLSEPPKARPPAPDFSFLPRDMQPPASTKPEPAKPAKVKCPSCGGLNAPHLRFCITCGSDLAARIPPPVTGPMPVLTAPSPARVEPAPRPVPVPDPAPIAPTPSIDVGARPSAKPTVRVCVRCHGASDPTSQFCKFCGAPLSDAPVAAPTPPAAAPAARPAPVPTPQAPVVAPAASTVRGRLVAIAKDGGEGPSHPLGESLDIGRLEGDIVVPEDRYVSPRHARVAFRDGQLRLRDLGSTNGVYLKVPGPKPGVDGADPELVEVPLEDQDLILLGQQVIRFEVVKGAEEGLGPAVQHGTLLFGTPAAPRHARLCQRTVEGVVRDVFYVRKAETVLGRESGDVVFPDDPFLSRRHAVIRTDAAKKTFFLADFGSSNGTFLQIRGEVPLRHGDEFRVGQQLFRVDLARAS